MHTGKYTPLIAETGLAGREERDEREWRDERVEPVPLLPRTEVRYFWNFEP